MAHKKKIIIISSSYPYGLKETFLHNEVIYLSKYFDLEIFPVIKSSPDATPVQVPPNVVFHQPIVQNNYLNRLLIGIINRSPVGFYIGDLKMLFKSGGSLKRKLTEWLLSLLVFRTIFSSSAYRSICSSEAEILYFYWGGQPARLYRKLNKKIFIRVHGSEVDIERHNGYIPVLKYKVVQQENIHYLPISFKAASMLNAVRPVYSTINRLGVFDLGINPLPPEEAPIRIVSCSNLISLKRVHLIIEALLSVNRPTEWVHFGDGPLFEEIKSLSSKLRHPISVRLMGRVKNEDIMHFYRNTPVDLFVNVSEFEGVPVSIMEAFSFGIPCFATNVGGTGEIVNENNGCLVEKDFRISVLSSFIGDIRNRIDAKKIRENARLTWQQHCSALINYEELTRIFNQDS
ncbi:MAG: glycosyltransferase [Candidatus Kuenenia stuttgartiensis]|nr:glycosyltransferase [Candidatus Kuenenia stuttgartiensis]